MLSLEAIYGELFSAVVRTATGKLFTEDQIKMISTNAVGKYFSEFLPTPQDEMDAQKRIEAASKHIAAASNIIGDIQQELGEQERKLDQLLSDVEEKRKLADHYGTLAKADQEKFNAFRKEMEDALRKELTAQAKKGSRLRQVLAIAISLLTLIAGAALGAYFKDIWKWVLGLFSGPAG